MRTGSFARSLILAWTGEEPRREFETAVLEKCLIASITNGPGTISGQAAKLSTSAGNAPNTAMIATLACIGDVHGGNGRRGVEYLSRIFRDVGLTDPYDRGHGIDLEGLAAEEVDRFSKVRSAAKEAGTDYERIPCLGHPVFRDKPVNHDPRERVIAEYLEENGLCNVFLDFYHILARRLKDVGIARNVWAVNLDGAVASVALGLSWTPLSEKRMTLRRASDIAFLIFALGRAAGGASEFLDHQDYGTPMDTRVPVAECAILTRPRD
jgi:citrate synthase